jgi:hypothetical protein
MPEPWREAIHDNDFNAEASIAGRHMEVALSGSADLMVKARLDRFLHSLHSEARRLALTHVSVDVRRLEFMNASCFATLVWWISTVQEQAAEDRYHIVFLSSPTIYWQGRKLSSLAGLAGDIISVQL